MLTYRQDGEKERQKMPRAKSSAGAQESKQESKGAAKAPEFANLDSYEIVDAKEYSKDGKTWHNATVRINGVTIYGCRAVTYVDHKDGDKEKDFLSFPQREGKDSAGNKKWYQHCFIALSPEDQQKICDAIWAKLDGK